LSDNLSQLPPLQDTALSTVVVELVGQGPSATAAAVDGLAG
jgi:hypothetical protein